MTSDKQQFNVYLPAWLVRRVKHAAIDHSGSVSEFVQEVLERRLGQLGLVDRQEAERSGPSDR